MGSYLERFRIVFREGRLYSEIQGTLEVLHWFDVTVVDAASICSGQFLSRASRSSLFKT